MTSSSIFRKKLFLAAITVVSTAYLPPDIPDIDDKILLTLLNPPKTSSGEVLLEGDMALPRNDEENDLDFRKALPNRGGIWTNRVIPYVFHESVNASTTQVIKDAMKEWEKKTCLKFVPRATEYSYLRYRTDAEGCWTYVGRMHTKGQDVNLGPGCEHLSVTTHEIGHSLGFFHEHSRRDRGTDIKILWQNIKKGLTSQFQTGNDSPRNVPYDVTSIMHYNPMAFSSRPFEKNTMVSLDPLLQPFIGESRGITFRDAKLANILYSCDDKCPNQDDRNCQNEGYLAPYRGGNEPCPCVCPPNTEGKFCERITGDYYGNRCGGVVTQETTIQTPNYPNRDKEGGSCSWVIQAPSGKRVSLKFLDFSFRSRYDKDSSPYYGLCVREQVEIRTGNMEEGNIYCGTDILPGNEFASSANKLLLFVRADNSGEGRGLKATVNFI